MEKPPLSRFKYWLPVTVLAIISVVFIVLYYIEFEKRKTHEQSIAEHLSTINALQMQLIALERTNAQLADEIKNSQEIRGTVETELQALIDMEWEKKYQKAVYENELSLEEYTILENQYSIDIDRLERAQSFLSDENSTLKKYVAEQKAINDAHIQTIAKLESEIKKNKNTIAKLNKPPEKLPPPEPEPKTEVITKPLPASKTVAAADKNNKQDVYRHVRLQSLSNAMINQDSSVRRKILVSVIPTIPDGVSGSELLALTNNMQGEDIFAVIQITNKYVTRPLDAQAISGLTSNMNEKDAEAVGLIFSNSE